MYSSVSTTVHTRILLSITALLICLLTALFITHSVSGINYSAGTYGSCTYGTCSISLTTSGSISVNVTPTAGTTTCTIASDTVTATTDSSTGYTVSLTDTDTSSTLNGPVAIAATTGTPASPTVLTTNTWGYRVDSIAGFGAGPTTAVTGGAIPTVTFAGVPLSSGTPGVIRTTATADSGTVPTAVWYGVCANSSQQSGLYTDSVTYTALIN